LLIAVLLTLSSGAEVLAAKKISPKKKPAVSTAEATQKAVIARAQQVLAAVKSEDFQALSEMVAPGRGIRFSPQAAVTADDRVILKDSLPLQARSLQKICWGNSAGSGLPIELSFKDYVRHFVYDADYAASGKVGYDKTIGQGSIPGNIKKFYPRAVCVEYFIPGKEGKPEQDWKSLRLVFEKAGSVWYLVGLVHDNWTP
jgi:hypothetical protein